MLTRAIQLLNLIRPGSPVVSAAVSRLLADHGTAVSSRRLRVRPLGDGWLASGSLWSVEDEAGPVDLVAKEGAYLDQEWDALKQLEALFAEGGLGRTVPRGIALSEQRSALLMTRVRGTTTLWKLGFGPKAALPHQRAHAHDMFRACGEWLARFQRATLGEPGAMHELTDAMQRMELWRTAWRPLAARLLPALERLYRQYPGVPLVMSHGDFAPRNVLAADPAVSVVDWEMVPQQLRTPAHDHHHFRLTLLRQQLLARLRGGWRPLYEAFDAGYRAADPPPLDPGVDRAARLATEVMVLDRQIKAHRRDPGRSVLLGRSWFIAQLVRSLLRRVSSCL